MDIWPAENRFQTTVLTMIFKAVWLLSAHALSSHHHNLSPCPHPHTKTKKKCYADIMGLEQLGVQYALFWNDEFSASPGGMLSQRQKCVRPQRKFICLIWPPYCGIFNYIYLIMAVSWWIQKRRVGPPSLFCLFVISSVRMIIAHLHN